MFLCPIPRLLPLPPWLEILLICSWLESQTEWAVNLKDMLRVSFRVFPRHVFVSQAGMELQKKYFNKSAFS